MEKYNFFVNDDKSKDAISLNNKEFKEDLEKEERGDIK